MSALTEAGCGRLPPITQRTLPPLRPWPFVSRTPTVCSNQYCVNSKLTNHFFQLPMISRRPSRVPRNLTRSCLPRLLLPTSQNLPSLRPRGKRRRKRLRRKPKKRRKRRPRPSDFYAVGIASTLLYTRCRELMYSMHPPEQKRCC